MFRLPSFRKMTQVMGSMLFQPQSKEIYKHLTHLFVKKSAPPRISQTPSPIIPKGKISAIPTITRVFRAAFLDKGTMRYSCFKEMQKALSSGNVTGLVSLKEDFQLLNIASPKKAHILMEDVLDEIIEEKGVLGIKVSHMKQVVESLELDFPSGFSQQVIDALLDEENSQDIKHYLQDMCATYPGMAKEVAYALAGGSPQVLCNYIESLELIGQEEIQKIAEAVKERYPRFLYENIYKFHITDERYLRSLALEAATEYPESLYLHSPCFGIRDQKILKEIALIAVEKDPKLLCEHITNFGITDQQVLKEIFLVMAKDPETLSSLKELFYATAASLVTDQEAFREIALTAADVNPESLSFPIDKFDITSLDGLKEIFRAVAKDSFDRACLLACRIKDPKILKGVLVTLIEVDSRRLCQDLVKMGIRDQEVLKEIALAIAKKNRWDLCMKLSTFGIQDQEALKEIALAIAKEGPWDLCRKLSTFGIQDQKVLKEVVLATAKVDAESVCCYINQMGITDQTVLKEIVLFVAKSAPEALCENLRSFRIEDQDFFKEIVLFLAERVPKTLCSNMHRLNIKMNEGHEFLRKVTLSIAERAPEALCSGIRWFGIEGQELLNEVALSLAERVPETLCIYIDNFHTIDQKHLKEVALSIAKRAPSVLFDNIERFGIKDRELLKEVAFFLLEKDPIKVAMFYDRFGIVEQEDFQKIAQKVVKEDPSEALKAILHLPLPRKALSDFALECVKREFTDPDVLLVFTRISNFRNSSIMKTLFDLFLYAERERELPSYMDVLKELAGGKSSKEPAFVKDKILPSMIPAFWEAKIRDRNGVIEDQTFMEQRKLYIDFLESKEIKRQLSNEVKYSLLQDLLSACIAMQKDHSTQPKQKLDLLVRACSYAKNHPGEASELFSSLKSLCLLGKGETVLKICPNASLKELNDYLDRIIFDDCNVDLSGIENLREKYSETFGSSLIPFSLKTYLDTLKTKADPAVQKDLTRFIRSTLEGTHKEERYRTDNNLTLKELKKIPQVFEGWKENLSPFRAKGGLTAEETDLPLELFEVPSIVSQTCQSIDGNPDYNKCLISYCMDGDIKLLTVKKDDTFIARALIRIIFDEEGKPSILMEPTYIKVEKEKESIEEAILKLAKQKARELGIPLFRKNEEAAPYRGTFKYIGGSCGTTYSDRMGGRLENTPIEVAFLALEKVDLSKLP